jgi:V/A-type H+/Na+-transporting ATPase subunit I
MFYPQAMTEIELIVPARDLLAVTKVLSGEGIFQQADSSYVNSSPEVKSDHTWQERASAYATIERRIQSVMQSIGMDEGLPPSADSESIVELDTVRPLVENIEQEVKKVTDQLDREHKRLEQLQSTLNQIEPIADIDIDISEVRNPQYLFSALGTIPNDHIDRLQTSLTRIPYVFLTLRQGQRNSVVWLAGSKNNSDILDRAARSAYLNPVNLPADYHGTPAEIIAKIRVEIEQTNRKISDLDKELVRLCETYEQQLHELLWEVRASRLMADAIVRFGRLHYTYLIVGWVLSSHLQDLLLRLKQISKDTLVQTMPLKRREEVPQNVPVALRNPKWLRPFQMLVTTYARPQYNEIDPTILIAVTFPLLFGAMFGDVGQGLVLAVLGFLMSSRKIKALNSLAGLGGLVAVCGLTATVFGFLYGSIFGVEELIHPLWMRPLDNIMQILILAIGAGIVLLIAGFIIGMFNAWVARNWGQLFFDRNGIAGFLLYIALLILVVQVFTRTTVVPMIVLLIVIAITGVAIMLSELLKRLVEGHRPLIVEGVGTYAVQAFFELFETLISFLSNSLSYVRVGAFAVAHAGLSSVIFILAALVSPGHGVGYWIVVALGNVFIIGFEGLIVGIQTMRLEYYEFFSKFFRGGGSTYEPLTLRPTDNR